MEYESPTKNDLFAGLAVQNNVFQDAVIGGNQFRRGNGFDFTTPLEQIPRHFLKTVRTHFDCDCAMTVVINIIVSDRVTSFFIIILNFEFYLQR